MNEGEAKFPTVSVKVATPDGVMFVHILEDASGSPVQVLINIGKSGSNLASWADATGRLVSKMLTSGHMGVYNVIEELSGITTAHFRRLARGEVIRSGPEGLAYALLKYRGVRYNETKHQRREGSASIGDTDE